MGIPVIDFLKAIPDLFGLHVGEQQKFETIEREDNFEIRHYYPYRIARTFVQGPYSTAMNKAFRRLSGYIFGNNKKRAPVDMGAPGTRASESIEMTTPVFQHGGGNGWSMTFIMPEKYKLSDLPIPNDRHIELAEEPGHMVAVLRFSGTVNEHILEEKENELMSWLIDRQRYAVLGQPFSAQYDPPFAIPFLRRNEVMVRLAIPTPRRTLH